MDVFGLQMCYKHSELYEDRCPVCSGGKCYKCGTVEGLSQKTAHLKICRDCRNEAYREREHCAVNLNKRFDDNFIDRVNLDDWRIMAKESHRRIVAKWA